MPSGKREPVPSEPYSSDFKLRIVLAYLQSPRRKKRILEENGIGENLLNEWHQQFMERAGQIFGGAPDQNPSAAATEDVSEARPSNKLAVRTAPPIWGIRINRSEHESYTSPSSSKDPPSWIGVAGRNLWKETGVFVWDEGNRKAELVSARRALGLIKNLRDRGIWRTVGIAITGTQYRFSEGRTPQRDSARNKTGSEMQKEERQAQPEQEEYVIFRLDPRVGEEVFAFLQQHESTLKQMAEEEKEQALAQMRFAWELLFEDSREREEKEIDLSKRKLIWKREELSATYICNHGTDRGTVALDEGYLFWRGCIERPNRFRLWSDPFVKLSEALDWAEGELIPKRKPNEPRRSKSKQENIRDKKESARRRIDLTPYRIKPADLEPKHPTYRAVIDIDHAPSSYKTMELSFGKLEQYAKKYPANAYVLDELRLDSGHVRVERPMGLEYEWYRIYSHESFDRPKIANAQAQQLWSQSALHQLYKEGNISRARYGVEEIETRYRTWLGELDNPENPWVRSSSRRKYMQELAERETLAYALDVDGFREFLGFSPEEISDDKLLATLHSIRAESICIPAKAKAESARWLGEHSEL